MSSERSRKPDLPWFHKRYTTYLVLVFCVLFLALTLLLGKQFRSNVRHENSMLLDDFRGQVSHLEHLLTMVTARIEAMRSRAEWDMLEMRLKGRPEPSIVFSSLTEEKQGALFHLDHIQPPLTAESVGNLSGMGQLQNRDSAFYRELSMALNLNPDFRATLATINDAAWVYYTSAADFINIYPWVSSTRFKFSKELQTHEFFKLGTPEKNPQRKVYWTEVYVDEYGKGLMTTCGAPIYDQDRFLGTVAIDLTVDLLNTIVKKFHPQSGEMFLVNHLGQILAHPSLVTSDDKLTKLMEKALPEALRNNVLQVMKISENKIVIMDGYEILRGQFKSAPWQAFYVRPARSAPIVFVNHIGIGPFLLTVGLLVLVLVVLKITHRKFLVPSGQLVDFIMRRSHHDLSVRYDAVPSFWKPWFHTIDIAFGENEELNEKIRKQNEELERKVAERTASLEESNQALRIQFEERRLAESEKERLQLQLQRAQKMEALGILAGGVAHDLNNVLSGLVSYPQLLLLKLASDNPLRCPIETIQQCGERAAAIVQDLLTMARRGVAVSEVVNLNDIIKDYLSSAEFKGLQLRHGNVKVVAELEEGLLNILGSSVHLAKSIMNLVTNAAEAMSDGGKVIISTSNAYVDRPIGGYDDVKTGDYVVLTVTDSGIGISPEDRERIFEPFYTRKVMGKSGTGLGMAVVWGTVKDHRGYVDVQSTPGEGSRFILYFPATRARCETADKADSLEHQHGNGELILIVDDVREQCEIGAQILQQLNYRVAVSNSGEEAVEYMKSHSPDLVLLDMIMEPGMDGLETYKKILEIRPGQKAIIVSGFSETERVLEAQKLGAGEYVKKPYRIEKIAAAIRRALGPQQTDSKDVVY
ncbi:MAG: response regulator [Syntrophobacteraceae bacterium]